MTTVYSLDTDIIHKCLHSLLIWKKCDKIFDRRKQSAHRACNEM